MKLAGIRRGDVVECDVKGRRFYALVERAATADERQVDVRPITPGITYRRVTARQIIEHWRKARHNQATLGGPQA